MLVSNPPRCCGLGLVHAVDPTKGDAGVAYIHTPASLTELESVRLLYSCMLELPNAVLGAHGSASPYLRLHCLTNDAGGAGHMKSRRNLQRVGQL
jgi:hypothetical protein